MADEAVKKQPTVEENTIEEVDRQTSESEQPIGTDETITTEVESPEKAVITPTEEESDNQAESEKMPQEQREAFIKQRLEIKELKKRLSEKESISALETLKPPTAGRVISQMPKAEQFLDVEGRIDLPAYQNAMGAWSESKSYREQTERDQIKFEMEQKFLKLKEPRLDPESMDFDQDLEKRVADRYGRKLLESFTKGLPEPSLAQTAKEILGETMVSPKEKQRISKEVQDAIANKAQAASTSTGVVSGRARQGIVSEELEELRQQTKEGDLDAMVKRMRAINE